MQAHSKDGLNNAYLFFLAPEGTEDVSFTLVANAACASGGICTSDGRQLTSVPGRRTIPGPVERENSELSVSDSEATEQDDATLDFIVTLDPASSESVSVDYATANGRATAGEDYTATNGRVTFAPGETSKTVSVPIIDDAVEDDNETLTLTLSNASGADIDNATATGTIRNSETPAEPLPASFSGMPSEHTGEEFTFGLAFSENVKLSYLTLRHAALNVSGCAVREAKRKQQGSNQRWTITVEPDSHAAVTVSLPAGSVETSDGRGLESAVSATVAGPVGVSVADARVDEAAGSVLAFAVTLSRTASGTVTAGADYTATSGTEKTIEVAVLDDSHDEGEETLTLRLSNASGGWLKDASATGMIENTDPRPRALMERFGRTAALHVVEQVQERIEAPREAGFEAKFAGRQLRPGMVRELAAEFLSQLAPSARANRVGAGVHSPTSVSSADVTSSLGIRGLADGASMAADPMGSMPGTGAGLNPRGDAGMGFGGGNMQTGSAFVMNHETRLGGILSFWSRGAQSQFVGREGELSLDGRVRTTIAGADYAKGPLVTGLSLSHSRGRGGYDGGYDGGDAGEVTSSVIGLYPWLGYKISGRITLWGVTGYGKGALTLTPGAGTALESGLSMAMAAGGIRGELAASVVGGFVLAFKADALWVGTAIDGVEGPGGNLAATSAAVTRYRTALEASRGYRFQRGLSLQPSLEVGLRRDGGDAETGAGVDLGGGLIVSDRLTGLSADVRVRMLLVHQDQGFRDRGVSLSFGYNPTPSTPLGFMAKLTPSWGGQATSGAQALWGRGGGRRPGNGRPSGGRTRAGLLKAL